LNGRSLGEKNAPALLKSHGRTASGFEAEMKKCLAFRFKTVRSHE
jgi:hypothetical protein